MRAKDKAKIRRVKMEVKKAITIVQDARVNATYYRGKSERRMIDNTDPNYLRAQKRYNDAVTNARRAIGDPVTQTQHLRNVRVSTAKAVDIAIKKKITLKAVAAKYFGVGRFGTTITGRIVDNNAR